MEKWWLFLENHSSTLFSQPANREVRRGGGAGATQTDENKEPRPAHNYHILKCIKKKKKKRTSHQLAALDLPCSFLYLFLLLSRWKILWAIYSLIWPHFLLFSFLFISFFFFFFGRKVVTKTRAESVCRSGWKGAEKRDFFSVPVDVGTWNCRLPVVVVVVVFFLLCVLASYFYARVSLISLFHSGNTPPTPFKKTHWRPTLPHQKILLSLMMSTAT